MAWFLLKIMIISIIIILLFLVIINLISFTMSFFSRKLLNVDNIYIRMIYNQKFFYLNFMTFDRRLYLIIPFVNSIIEISLRFLYVPVFCNDS